MSHPSMRGSGNPMTQMFSMMQMMMKRGGMGRGFHRGGMGPRGRGGAAGGAPGSGAPAQKPA